MTITTEVLIAAARAIGIKLHAHTADETRLYIDDFDNTEWNPLHDKAQLMDFQYKLKFRITYNSDGSGRFWYTYPKFTLVQFDNTFKSFASAIILAAAEIGRGME